MIRLNLALGLCAAAAYTPAASAASVGTVGKREVDCTGVKAISPLCKSNEAAFHRDAFYVGGRDLKTDRGTSTADQLYVEKLTPTGGVTQANPLVLFHGGGFSGITWLNTPDNRKGWASHFIEQGYAVYIVDSIAVGRSTQIEAAGYAPVGAGSPVETLRDIFTAPQDVNQYPQSQLHTQWPGTGREGDPVFEQFRRSALPLSVNMTRHETGMRAAGCELLSLLGTPSFLISHSFGAVTPFLLTNDCPQLVAGNINLEPSAGPFYQFNLDGSGQEAFLWGMSNTPIDYDPPVTEASGLKTEFVGNATAVQGRCRLLAEPAPKLPKVASVPYLAVAGEASIHILWDHCAAMFIRQVGGTADYVKLADVGVRGNGHFSNMEKNNLEVAQVVQDWIRKRAAPRV